MLIVRLVLVIAIFVGANILTLAAPQSIAAIRVGGEAYGLAVGNPPVGTPGAAYVQLPPEGGSVSDTSPGAGYGIANSVGSTTRIETSSVGDVGPGNVTSTTTMADGELLSGLVRARDIRVVASVAGGRTSGSTTFGSLIVAGISYVNPQPNTRIEVPGVGTVILNEQLVGGDGRDVAAIIVRAVRIIVTEGAVFDLPRGTEIILAHAAAGVPDIVASRAVAAAATPTATKVPWSPISDYRPIVVSLNNDNGDSDNFTIDNGNGNEDAAGGGGGGGGGTGTPSGIVITVVVIQCPATPTPNPPNPTPTPIACP